MLLNGEQIKQLHQSLQSAFPKIAQLEMLVRIQLNENLESVAGGTNLEEITFNLIKWGESQGRIEELVKRAYHENPGNPELHRFAQQFLNLPSETKTESQTPTIPSPSRDIRIVKETLQNEAHKSKSLVWLHFSDLHACKARTGWDSRRILKSMCKDLVAMEANYGLHPDLIFFTGDAAFGQIGAASGEQIMDQFQEAHDFIQEICSTFTPSISQENVFLIPGNHDVNREVILRSQMEWLDRQDKLENITSLLQSHNHEWQRYMDRLADYRTFLKDKGYDHLLADPDRLIYAVTRELKKLRIGIFGLNSAWSSGRDAERGKLWFGGNWQIGQLKSEAEKQGDIDISIALVHHPCGWFVEYEDPEISREIEREFHFHLHGHEHQGWVNESVDGYTRIAAAACYDRSDRENGYNFVRLNLDSGQGEVWLRQFERLGGGWVPRIVHGKTDHEGRWLLNRRTTKLPSQEPDETTQPEKFPPPRVFISYKRWCDPDQIVANACFKAFSENYHVFIDTDIDIGLEWKDEIEASIVRSDYFILLLSAQSINSEMVERELDIANSHRKIHGRPIILPVRLNYLEEFPSTVRAILNPLHWAFWQGHEDTPMLLSRLKRAIDRRQAQITPTSQKITLIPAPTDDQILPPVPATALDATIRLPEPKGAMRIGNRLYIERATDKQALRLIKNEDVTLAILGSRQMGKSSLLVRTIAAARDAGKCVVSLDFQELDSDTKANASLFFEELWNAFWTELQKQPERKSLEMKCKPPTGIQEFNTCMESCVLAHIGSPLVLAIDEAEAVFENQVVSDDFYRMLRGWHNRRAYKPRWEHINIVLVTSTEPEAFIKQETESPFNVATSIRLMDFSPEETAALYRAYGSPYLETAWIPKLSKLIGGHPFLMQRALYSVYSGSQTPDELLNEDTIADNYGLFGDHLRSYLLRLKKRPGLFKVLQGVLEGKLPDNAQEDLELLKGAGLIVPTSGHHGFKLRCKLYEIYFRKFFPA